MEELKIDLKFNPEHFKEIYFHNGQGNMFTYKPTQKAILYFISVALVTCIIYFVSYQMPAISWLIVLGLILLLFAGINAGIVITQYLRWKADAKSFIRELAQYKSFHIHLTSVALEFTQDSTITIDKWDSIKSVKIFGNYLMLYKEADPTYIFPAKSMKPAEFIKLKDFITNIIRVAVEE